MAYFSDNEVSFEEVSHEEEDVPMDEDSVGENNSSDDEEVDGAGKAKSLSSRISVASSGFGYNDDEKKEEEEKEPQEDTKQNPKRGKGVNWIVESEFDSMVEFNDSAALQDLMDNYNQDNKKANKDGHIIRSFICKFSKRKKGFACPVKSRTILNGNKMTVYRIEGAEHDHTAMTGNERKNFNFDQRIETKMKELLELNVNSRNIRKHLIEKGFFSEETAPPDQVFYSKTSNLRKKLNLDRKKIGLREFEDIIEGYSEEPEDPKEPFIVTSVVEQDKNGKLRYSVMFSSAYLIKTYMKPGKDWVMSLDATYQTNSEDCPLIFFGSSTKSGKFNGVGAILSNREDKIAYNFLFEMVKEVAEPRPLAIMADADKAMTSSIRDILPNSNRLTCFFHVMKNVKMKLGKVKKADSSISQRIKDDIRTLQANAVDKESFFTIYNLMEKKWTKEHKFKDSKLKNLVIKFFEYFSRIWIHSEECNWFQAANPQHITTNNNVEGTNQAFKKEYTGRTRLSFPNMFKKLKDLLKDWSRTNSEDSFDLEKIPVKIVKSAEELMAKCNSDDKKKNLLLSKPTKPSHRNIIKEDSGIIRGFVKEVNIIPRNPEQFSLSKEDFAELGQKIHSRRSKLNYKSFDEFSSDSKEIAIVETVFGDKEDPQSVFFACNCDVGPKLPSGCKGKECVHVTTALIQAGKIKIRAADRRISGYHHQKGAPMKNRKQNA